MTTVTTTFEYDEEGRISRQVVTECASIDAGDTGAMLLRVVERQTHLVELIARLNFALARSTRGDGDTERTLNRAFAELERLIRTGRT